ncbi:hypothetical protein [Tessaracoccus sp. OH4464_COT-324]|uniref:hypothetical protein n=1 Tax=Tessaracoccus sp. OH4464_COT-324 TaxID=2491059 RepID=UPI000F630AF5|nr:hypothetical protein [Tessaracoccus sp. OH4464_COT-324]RRD45178.1 hypothetical protein EII42_11640 [Tessaracoccus sp. OH4464_COT-324]
MEVREAEESSVEEYAQADLTFRIYFIEAKERSTYGSSRVVDVSDCDVIDVIRWAQENASPTEVFSIALRLGSPDRAVLYWLVGTDGNDVTTPTNEKAKQLMNYLRQVRVTEWPS